LNEEKSQQQNGFGPAIFAERLITQPGERQSNYRKNVLNVI
jgi:hypothetical protein